MSAPASTDLPAPAGMLAGEGLPPVAAAHFAFGGANAAHSRFVQRIRRRYAADLRALAPGLPDAGGITHLVQDLMAGGRSLVSALRVARQLVLERLATLDVECGASLDDITLTMTALAETTLERALAQAEQEADQRHGPPLDAAGLRLQMWVVGMGKLGARELNVSSDIDLIYVYESCESDGQTTGDKPVSVHEYFCFVARQLYALIGETTEDGFVFRVDLALRPNGHSGPPVLSLSMLEEYLQVQGREWERFAWLKSRVVAPRSAVQSTRALALRSLVTPFVYRRYLDYGVFEGLRQLHRRVREEAQRRAAGRPERANDVKLSRGGIREIEFIVQLLLVVRGGQFPEIRTRSTLRSLERLVGRGLMKAETATQLAEAYVFLRRVEHRIQYLDDQQTHLLPTDDADLSWLANSLGFHAPSEVCKLLARLGEVRELVAGEFDAMLSEGQTPEEVRLDCRSCVPKPLAIDNPKLLDRLPEALAAKLRPLIGQPRLEVLRDVSRLRLGRLMQRTGRLLDAQECSELAATRFVDWVEPLLRRENYLALLVERPEVHKRLLRVMGMARWPTQYLLRHPGVIDELADEALLRQRFNPASFTAELEERLQGWQRSGEDDEGQLLDTLRHAHHAELFRTLVRDVEGALSVEEVADDLSNLADAVLSLVLRWAWDRLKQRHRAEGALAIIAYGKHGGKELGYGSDLDLVFVYDETAATDEADQQLAQEVYAAFGRKLVTWLTLRTAAGELFDIDTALRPNGNSGLLVTSIGAFERYQVGRGNNTAWTWEHQALTRARWAAGAASVAPRFEATRRAVLTATRDPESLRGEVKTMRAKLREARPVSAKLFDVKHSPGGMLDVEFAVQYLVLAHSAKHPALQDNVGNIALLLRAESAGLLPAGIGRAAADAYRELRHAQHRARLDEKVPQFEAGKLARSQAAVLALWRLVFGMPDS